MAVELTKIEFKDGREKPVMAKDFNDMQNNTQTALNTLDSNKQDTLTQGEGIEIKDGVISATGGGGFNITTLYNNSTQSASKTVSLTDDKFSNYKMLVLLLKTNAQYNYQSIMTEDIDTSKSFQSPNINTGSVGRYATTTFSSDTQFTTKSSYNSECWLTKVYGIS
jgi:hypothetical protein